MAQNIEFVLDCSMTVSWIFEDEATSASDEALQSLAKGRAWVSGMWRYEIANVMRSATLRKRCTAKQAVEKLQGLTVFDIQEHMSPESPMQLLERAVQYDLSSYDASYLALAEARRLPLATLDKKLIAAAKKAKIPVLFI